MLNLDATQLAALQSSDKKIRWCFDLVDIYGVSYTWTTGGDVALFGKNYEQKILNFSGINLQAGKSEIAMQAANGCTFDVRDVSPEDFQGDASAQVCLVINDVAIDGWLFKISNVTVSYQVVKFTCIDPIQWVLDMDWPPLPLVDSIFPNSDGSAGNLVPPVVCGTGYVPCACVLSSTGKRYYLLGPDTTTYTVTKVSTSKSWNVFAEFESTSYTFNQITENGYVLLEPIVIDSDGDGTADTCGLMLSNGKYLPLNVQFSRGDLGAVTNPAEVIKGVLITAGIPSGYIDNAAFTAAAAVFTSRGIVFNGGYSTKQPLRKVLAEMLNQCGAYLTISYHIGLAVRDLTSVENLGADNIVKGTFGVSVADPVASDAGHVAWAGADTPMEMLTKAVCPVGSTASAVADDTLAMPLIHDGQQAQKLGIMYYQRNFARFMTARFSTSVEFSYLQPEDMITLDDGNYGTSSWDGVIETIKLGAHGQIDFTVVQYSPQLTAWADISPAAVAAPGDTTTAAWQPVYTGDDGGIAEEFSISAKQIVVGNVSQGKGWGLNDDGLFGYAGFDSGQLLEGHAFSVSDGIPWQRGTPYGLSPTDPNFKLDIGDAVLGAFNYGAGIMWDQSAQALYIAGAVFAGPIFSDGAIDYSKISSGPPVNADNTVSSMYSTPMTKNTGDFVLNSGADIVMNGTGTNTSKIVLKPAPSDASTWAQIEAVYEGSAGALAMTPCSDGCCGMQIGTTAKTWESVGVLATGEVALSAATVALTGSVTVNANSVLTSASLGTGHYDASRGDHAHATAPAHDHYGQTLYPYYVGNASHRAAAAYFDTVYFCTAYEDCAAYVADEHDCVAILRGLTFLSADGGRAVRGHEGLKKLDKRTLPHWLTNRDILYEELRAGAGALLPYSDFLEYWDEGEFEGWRSAVNPDHYRDVLVGAMLQLAGRVDAIAQEGQQKK